MNECCIKEVPEQDVCCSEGVCVWLVEVSGERQTAIPRLVWPKVCPYSGVIITEILRLALPVFSILLV